MAEHTSIEWCDHTFNPWEGCQNVGPGCDNCYAENRNARWNKGVAVNWGPGAPRRRTSAANWKPPLAWNAAAEAFAEANGNRKQRVFCSSLADVFDNAVDPSWRADLAALILATPKLEWLLLTKRIGNALDMLILMFPDGVPPNVRVGATIVNQEEAARDLPKLQRVAVAIHLKPFLSMEPLLGPVDLTEAKPSWYRWVGQVIVGGESGPNARPMHPDWARSLRDQCAAAGVAYNFKQWGEWRSSFGHPSETRGRFAMMAVDPSGWTHTSPVMLDRYPRQFNSFGSIVLERVGKKAAGRLLDGRTHDGFPDAALARAKGGEG